jgi:RNA polymerase sigma factor (sigma-70 family)
MIDVTQHTNLVHMVCQRYRSQTGRSFSYEDLFQAGCEGLLRAARTYDPALGALSTYAVPMIRKYVRRLVATQARTVKVPQYAQDAAAALMAPEPRGRKRRTNGAPFNWSAPGASVASEHGDGALDLARHPGRVTVTFAPYQGFPSTWRRNDAAAAAGIHRPDAETSLDAPHRKDEDARVTGGIQTALDFFSAPSADPDAIEASDLARVDALAAESPELTDAERFVIRSRLAGSTQPELAGLMGVTKARIGQIQASGVEKLAKKVKTA